MKKILKYCELDETKKEILKKINKDLSEEEKKEIYDSFVDVLSSINNKNAINIIKKLATIKPIYSFQTIYNLIKEFTEEKNENKENLTKLRKYTKYEIDIFMLINVIYF
jgi:hypothetical protein